MTRAPSEPSGLHNLPLGFLPAFEAAGRRGSFAAAAAELHVTPSAISQQIRTLEGILGVALFERNGRGAVLTCDGERYMAEVGEALRLLAASTARLRRRAQSSVLRLQTMALAAHEFLLPRLPSFRQRFPRLELQIETSNEVVDFRYADCDAALRIGGPWPELDATSLGGLVAAPVCSAELAETFRCAADIQHHTLLDPGGQGQRCLAALSAAAGLRLSAAKVWRFETCQEALRAAEHGLGVAFGVFPVVTHWVQSGRLVVPLADRVPLPGQLSFVHRPKDEYRLPLPAVGAWLREQFAALAPLPPGRLAQI